MSETQNGNNAASAVNRADALLNRVGKRVRDARAEIAQREHAAGASVDAAPGQPARPATERADELLDRTGERLGRFASTFSLRVRKMAALAREEGEDILADAQALRQGNGSERP